MAGKRQHYIPQFLQRGFTIDQDGKQAWVVRSGEQPYKSGIQNIGVEGYFYTDRNDSLIDERITNKEDEINSIVNDLKSMQDGDIVPSDLVAPLIAHFEIRTRHLRMNFSQVLSNIIRQISYIFENEEVIIPFLQKQIIKDKSLIADLVNSDSLIPKNQKKLFIELFQRNPDLLIRQLTTPILRAMAIEIRKNVSSKIMIDTVKAAHLKALKKTIAPDEKIAIFSKLQFKIVKTHDILFLGDSIVVFVDADNKCKPFYKIEDKLKSIIMPLDWNTYLFGFDIEARNYTGEQLREMTSSCSLEFFISSERNIASQYSEKIGINANLLSKEQVFELLDDVLNE